MDEYNLTIVNQITKDNEERLRALEKKIEEQKS